MKVVIGSDHAGFQLKNAMGDLLRSMGNDVLDIGAFNENPSDYPDFAEAVDRAILDEVEFEYLYSEGDDFHFMNTKNYEQMQMSREELGETVYYLIPSTIVKVEFFEEKAIGVDLPDTMDMKVIQTEPTLQKATASAVMKPATLETGLVVQVPPFVNEGDRIKVDTSEARYVQRVE